MSLTVAGLALMIGLELQGGDKNSSAVLPRGMASAPKAGRLDPAISPSSVDDLSDGAIALSELSGGNEETIDLVINPPVVPDTVEPLEEEGLPALPGTASVTPEPVKPAEKHRSTITITESDEAPDLPTIKMAANADKKPTPVFPALPNITVEEEPTRALPEDNTEATLSFSGDPALDVAEGDTSDEVVETAPKKDIGKAASLDFSVLDMEEAPKKKAQPSVTKKAETSPKKEPEKNITKKAEDTKKTPTKEAKKATALLESGELPRDDGRAKPTKELMEELDLEVPEIKRLVRNLNDEAEEGDLSSLEASRKQDPLLYRYPKEPYNKNKERPVFSYRNQVIPTPIYKRNYNHENRHLPRRVVQSDYDQKFFGAAMDDNLNGLRALYPRITSIDMQNDGGATPLIFAIRYGRMDAVRYLLANGANPDLGDNNGFTPLHHALFADRPDIVHVLRSNGANVALRDLQGFTPFDHAINQRHYQIAAMLKGPELNLNAEDASGQTLLERAIKGRDTAQVAFLLEQGADPNRYDRQGYTPLMHAAFNGDNMMLNTLIQFGADPSLRDQYGRKAADIAQLGGFAQVASYLGSVEATRELFKAEEQARYIGNVAPVIDPYADKIRMPIEPELKPKKEEGDASASSEWQESNARIITERVVHYEKASYITLAQLVDDAEDDSDIVPALPLGNRSDITAPQDDDVVPALTLDEGRQADKAPEAPLENESSPAEEQPIAESEDIPDQEDVAPKAVEETQEEEVITAPSPKQERREADRRAYQEHMQKEEQARQAEQEANRTRKRQVTPLREIKKLPGIESP